MCLMRRFVLVPLLVAASLPAQTASFAGSVVRDSASHPAVGVEIWLPALSRLTTTNARGGFRFDSLPEGTYAVTVRRIGFSPVHDTVSLRADRIAQRAYELVQTAQLLDSLRILASSDVLSPTMRAFEQRRASGMGKYIGERELRKHDSEKLTDILLASVPGLRAIPEGGSSFLASSRGLTISGGTDLLRSRSRNPLGEAPGARVCWVSIFLDGVPIFDPSAAANDLSIRPPDLTHFDARQFQAVEFYASTATVPAQYRIASSNCGTLLLWSRER